MCTEKNPLIRNDGNATVYEVDKVLKQNEAAQASQLEVPYCHIAGCKLGAYKKF